MQDSDASGDSVRFVERAVAAGVDARVGLVGMQVHGFIAGVGRPAASTKLLNLIGESLAGHFAMVPKS